MKNDLMKKEMKEFSRYLQTKGYRKGTVFNYVGAILNRHRKGSYQNVRSAAEKNYLEFVEWKKDQASTEKLPQKKVFQVTFLRMGTEEYDILVSIEGSEKKYEKLFEFIANHQKVTDDHMISCEEVILFEIKV